MDFQYDCGLSPYETTGLIELTRRVERRRYAQSAFLHRPGEPYCLPLPVNEATWTQKWDTLKAWMSQYNHDSQYFLQACRDQLPAVIPSDILKAVLVKFFALVKQAKIEFDALARTRNPFEVRAKQALRKVQEGIDQLRHQDWLTIPCAEASCLICAKISEHNTTRYICESLFAHVAGTLIIPEIPIIPENLFLDPEKDDTWTQKWDTLKAWMTQYNHHWQSFLQACQSELPAAIPRYTLNPVLVKFFALVEQATIEFDALAPTRNPFVIEVRARQALRKVQEGIDQLCHQDVLTNRCATASCLICAKISEHNETRYICEWLFARVAGTLTIPQNLIPDPEKELESSLNRISRLSFRMGPATSRNQKFREVLQTALLALTDLHNHHEYRNHLEDFKRKQGALLSAILRHADSINSEDSRLPGQLCLELQQIAHNLAGFAAQRADRYQKLYEYFVKNRESISESLDSASRGQGQTIVDGLIDNLKEVSSSSRREVDFWASRSRHLSPWPDLSPVYKPAIRKISNLNHLEQIDNGCNPTSGDNLPKPEAQNVAAAAQKVSVSYSKVLTLQDGRIRKSLLKTQPDMKKLLDKTKGYFEYVVKEATAQPSRNVAMSIVANALSVAESWKRLYRTVKYEVFVLRKIFSSKICITASAFAQEFDLKVSTNDHDVDNWIISKNLHPFLSDLELCVLDIKKQYLSFADSLSNFPSVLSDFNNLA